MKLNSTDSYWFLGLTALALGYCLLTKTSLFESSVIVTGILCVALIAIGRKEGYLFGLYNCAAYAWIAYQNGLFGEVLLNLLFYLPTGVIGFFMWRKMEGGKGVLMRRLSWPTLVKIMGSVLLFVLILGFLLTFFKGQKNPFLDATTNAVGICATFLMMYRYAEQWIFYILLNCITIALWVLRYIDQGTEVDSMIFMWVLFLANSIFGYVTWSRNTSPNAFENDYEKRIDLR